MNLDREIKLTEKEGILFKNEELYFKNVKKILNNIFLKKKINFLSKNNTQKFKDVIPNIPEKYYLNIKSAIEEGKIPKIIDAWSSVVLFLGIKYYDIEDVRMALKLKSIEQLDINKYFQLIKEINNILTKEYSLINTKQNKKKLTNFKLNKLIYETGIKIGIIKPNKNNFNSKNEEIEDYFKNDLPINKNISRNYPLAPINLPPLSNETKQYLYSLLNEKNFKKTLEFLSKIILIISVVYLDKEDIEILLDRKITDNEYFNIIENFNNKELMLNIDSKIGNSIPINDIQIIIRKIYFNMKCNEIYEKQILNNNLIISEINSDELLI